jgi:hypothetical protein
MLEILNRWGSGFSTSAPPRAALLLFFMYIENKILVPRKDSELLKKKKRLGGERKKATRQNCYFVIQGPLQVSFSLLFSTKFCSNLTHLRKWQPTPVLLPGKSYGWRSLVGCSP